MDMGRQSLIIHRRTAGTRLQLLLAQADEVIE
jgi:hypothetical protein